MNLKEKLKQLIAATHRTGVSDAHRIAELRRQLAGLERLNRERRAELVKLTPPPAGNITMYDSVSIGEIPPNAEAVAGYVGGSWPTFPDLVRDWPRAHVVSIAVNAGEDARCLDVESGDAVPGQAPGWVRRQQARGIKRPWVYADASNMPAVVLALLHAGIKTNEVILWVAHYTGSPHIPAGYDACQYTDRALNRNLDASLCKAECFQ